LTFSHLSAASFESHLKSGRKRPRVREAVSCWQCRSRKIRCDRESPCKPCQDRGVAQDCAYSNSGNANSTNSANISKGQNPPARSAPSSPSLPSPSRSRSSQASQRTPQTHTAATPSLPIVSTPPDSSSSRGDTPEPTPNSILVENGIHERAYPPCDTAFPASTSKTRMIGLSHWMAPCNAMPVVKAMLNRSTEFQPARKAFVELKSLIQMHNAIPPLGFAGPAGNSNLLSLLPDRQTTDVWAAQFLRTYGRVYCIIDYVALVSDLDQIYNGSLDNSVCVAKILLVIAIAMQSVEPERLSGRKLARHVEDCIHQSSRFQDPSIEVVQVLLLLIIMKTISASDTDNMYDLLAIQGLATQITSSMGLHRDPALFSHVSPYHAEVRKRLWGCFLRLNLEYCVRSGTQFGLRLDESDCPLPTAASLGTLNTSTFTAAAVVDFESAQQSESDMIFNIAATRLAKIIAPLQQALHSASPRDLAVMLPQLRTSLDTLLSDLPSVLRPGTQTPDPIEELQQSLVSIPMHSFLSIVTLGIVVGSPDDNSKRVHLTEIWDYGSSILHQFQSLCQSSHDVSHIAFHLFWTDIGRAVLSTCSVVGQLPRPGLSRIMSPRPQHTACLFQQLLVKSLTFLSILWQGLFHLGPVAAKMNLLLAVSLSVTSNLYSDNYNMDNPHAQQKLIDEGVAAAERVIAEMKLTMKEHHQ
ncbi:hypothetical protein B0T17DRAFT_455543, partial [Bombardia bombarda]